MNKVCKEYISDAKKFFPIMGKDERNFLRGLSRQLEEFCEEKNITSKQELFEQYRQPYNVANDYYESVDTEKIIKKIKFSKYVKTLISVLIAILLISYSVFLVFWNHNQQMATRQEMVDSYTVLQETETAENDDHDIIKSDDYIEDNELIEEEIIE